MILVKFEFEEFSRDAVKLWQEAFGDSEEYIDFFHSAHDSCFCLMLTEDDELTSALYLIDGELCGQQGYYLFAAATFKAFRGRGYMASLLKKAEGFAKENGKSFIALVPAEDTLFDYYSRFGYKTAFYAKKQLLTDKIGMAENMFEWCSEHTKYIMREHEKYGTDIFEKDGVMYSVFEGGYIKVPTEKNEAYRYGMLLPLDECADKLTNLNSYIGLTLE